MRAGSVVFAWAVRYPQLHEEFMEGLGMICMMVVVVVVMVMVMIITIAITIPITTAIAIATTTPTTPTTITAPTTTNNTNNHHRHHHHDTPSQAVTSAACLSTARAAPCRSLFSRAFAAQFAF